MKLHIALSILLAIAGALSTTYILMYRKGLRPSHVLIDLSGICIALAFVLLCIAYSQGI